MTQTGIIQTIFQHIFYRSPNIMRIFFNTKRTRLLRLDYGNAKIACIENIGEYGRIKDNLPFETNIRDVREVYSTVGSFAVAEGNRQKALLFITFPLFMLWVKFVKVCYYNKDKFLKYVKKLYRRISIWKT